MKTILFLLVVVCLVGCGTTGNKIVPSNQYKDDEKEITLAQDNQAKDILIDKRFVDKHGVTNFTKIRIKGLQAKNNPDAIDSAGRANAASIAGYAQLFQAGAEFGQDALMKSLQAYAAINGVPASSGDRGRPVITRSTAMIPPKVEALLIDGKEYILEQEPTAGGNGIYVYSHDGKNYTYVGGKMILLP